MIITVVAMYLNVVHGAFFIYPLAFAADLIMAWFLRG